MTAGIKSFLTFLFIPFLIALGHDVYLNYFSDAQKIKQVKQLQVNPEKFLVSDAGWVWNEYNSGSLNMIKDMTSAETWIKFFDPVLEQPTMIVSLSPLAIGIVGVLIYLIFTKLFSGFGSRNTANTQDDFAVYKHAKTKSMEFKKK